MSDVSDRIAFLMRQEEQWTSLADAAEAYGIHYETFKKIASHHSSDKRGLSRKNAIKIARHHNVSLGWLLFNEGEPIQQSGIPLKGKIGAGQEMMIFEDPGNEEPIPFDIVGADATAFEAEGNSMYPLARHGDLVFVGPAKQDLKSLIGVECAVVLVDGRRFFKTIENGSRPGRYDLVSHNAETIRDVEIHSAGPLIAVKRRNAPTSGQRRKS